VPHRDSVAHADYGKDDGRPAGHAHAVRRRARYVVKVQMARHYFAFRACYADQRPFKFFVNETQRLKQRAVRGAGYALEY
jgi:hypothetical protein